MVRTCKTSLQASDILYKEIQCMNMLYSKTCAERSLSERPKIGSQNQLLLNAGQKYFRMVQWAFIRLPFNIKIFVLSILSGRFTQVLLFIFFSVLAANELSGVFQFQIKKKRVSISDQKRSVNEDLAEELAALENAVKTRELAKQERELSADDIAELIAAGDLDPADLELDEYVVSI